jgi:hypothetical protein
MSTRQTVVGVMGAGAGASAPGLGAIQRRSAGGGDGGGLPWLSWMWPCSPAWGSTAK